MTADPKPQPTPDLVEELAEHLARQMFANNRIIIGNTAAGWDDLEPAAQQRWIDSCREIHAAPVLAFLAERGRLVPEGAQIETQWGGGYPGDQVAPGNGEDHARFIVESLTSYAKALGWSQRAELHRRTVITTPWTVGPQDSTQETPDVHL